MAWNPFRRRRGPASPPATTPVVATEEEQRLYRSLARPAALLRPTPGPEGPPPLSQPGSRLGGRPVLADAGWPHWDDTPLSFLAAVDLTDLAGLDLGFDLPPDGTLNFFYEADRQQAWGFDPDHQPGWRVLFTPPGEGEPVAAPAGALTFDEVALTVEIGSTHPGADEPAIEALIEQNGPGLWALIEEHDEPGTGFAAHQIGGWPALIQGSLWLEAQLASNGLHVGGPDGYRSPEARALASGADDWVLLLQLDSDDRAGWMWGDGGRLYFVIRRTDLATARFERTWMILQCY